MFSHVFSSDGLNNTLLSQGRVLENGSSRGNSGRNVHSKDRGWGKKPLIARVQLMGQPTVGILSTTFSNTWANNLTSLSSSSSLKGTVSIY